MVGSVVVKVMNMMVVAAVIDAVIGVSSPLQAVPGAGCGRARRPGAQVQRGGSASRQHRHQGAAPPLPGGGPGGLYQGKQEQLASH